MANPFEDPAVQKAASNQKPMYSDSAYDDVEMNDGPTNKSGPPPPPPNAQINVSLKVDPVTAQAAMNAGQTAMNNQMNNLYNDKQQADQQTMNHNERPPPPAWIEKCFAWLPIRTFAFFGGCAFVILPWIDMIIINDLTFSGFFILFYVFLFGLVTVFIESPSWKCTRSPQLGIYFWARFTSRMWGRACFYIFVSILTFSNFDLGGFSATGLAGVYMLIIGLLMYYVSYAAAKKYVRMFIYMASGSEGEELQIKMEAKYNELDVHKEHRVGSEGIVKLAADAGRTLTNAERHAIQTFLDEGCNGAISKEDWMAQWTKYNMKTKFL